VDLILDRGNAAGMSGDGFVAMSGAVAEGRVSAVKRVLSVLSEMPAVEPPVDLAVKTLQRVARMGGSPATRPTSAQPFIDPTQPMA
jgi:hypothetical protein